MRLFVPQKKMYMHTCTCTYVYVCRLSIHAQKHRDQKDVHIEHPAQGLGFQPWVDGQVGHGKEDKVEAQDMGFGTHGSERDLVVDIAR